MAEVFFKNVPVHFTVNGNGRAVVLLHGFLESGNMWRSISNLLSKRFKVVCVDLLGHGNSGNLGYIHGMEDQAKMVKKVLDSLNLRRYVLIGHSMGGYVGLAFAELFPQNIKGLCLLNSTALPDDEEKRINRERTIDAVKAHKDQFIKLAIPNLFSEENRSVFMNEIENLTQDALRISTQGVIAALEGMKIRDDRTAILKENNFPIFFVMSKKDPALNFESLKNQIKNTRVASLVLEDGHMSYIENKEIVESELDQFCKRCYRKKF